MYASVVYLVEVGMSAFIGSGHPTIYLGFWGYCPDGGLRDFFIQNAAHLRRCGSMSRDALAPCIFAESYIPKGSPLRSASTHCPFSKKKGPGKQSHELFQVPILMSRVFY